MYHWSWTISGRSGRLVICGVLYDRLNASGDQTKKDWDVSHIRKQFHLIEFAYRTPLDHSMERAEGWAMGVSRLYNQRVVSGGYDEDKNKPRMRVTCGVQ
jgi:hypothetical protein